MEKEDKPFKEWMFARKRDEWMRRLAAVPEREMPSGAKLIGFRLSLYMREDQRRAWPTMAALSDACGMSARVIQDHVTKLQKGRWLDVRRQRHKGNIYWLRYANFSPDAVDEMEMDEDANGSGVPLLSEA